MEEVPERWVGYMDWRSRPALRGKHGGYFAASFVLVVEIMENLAYLANASNLVTYLTGFMHFSPARSANTVTNFMGTAFLLALLGGFLSDAFFTTYHIYLISALVEFVVIAAATFSSTGAERQSISVLDVATSPSKRPSDDDSIAIKPLPVTSPPSTNLSFFNRALHSNHKPLLCTTGEVEDVKIIIKILPIFLSTIMLNCCLAQLSTFSVQQAATMNTRVGRLTIPPASLPVFPIIFIMLLAPIYNHLIAPFARRATGTESGITHLQRIGVGLSLSVAAMAIAALVEVKRKHVARDHGMMDSTAPLPVTFFWVAMQYLCLGSADLFTLAGLLEFFFTEAPAGMRSLATALTWASLAMGYYLSSVLVTVVNGVTRCGRGEAWLEGKNLNYYKLERFYWLMCGMSAVNFGNYLFWATRYTYRSVRELFVLGDEV